MNRADAWRARATFNNLRFEDNFNVLEFPIARYLLEQVSHAMRVHQKLTGSNRATPTDARGYNHELIRVRIDQPCHYGVILVGAGLLLYGTIERPVMFSGIGPVLDPKLRHCSVVRKMKTQRGGQSQCPAIVERTNEDRWAAAKIGQSSAGLALHAIRFSIGVKQASHIYQRTHVINNDGDHGVVKCGFTLRVCGIAQANTRILTLIGETEEHRLGRLDEWLPKLFQRRRPRGIPNPGSTGDKCEQNQSSGDPFRRNEGSSGAILCGDR